MLENIIVEAKYQMDPSQENTARDVLQEKTSFHQTKETREKFSLAVLLRYRRLSEQPPRFPGGTRNLAKEGTKGLPRPFVIVSVVVP